MPSEDKNKLFKLKELVEKHEGEKPKEAKEQLGSQKDISEIILRLKRNSKTSEKPSEERFIGIRDRVEDSSKTINIGSRDELPVSSASNAGSSAGIFATIGAFYKVFKQPLFFLSSFLSSLPLSQNLRRDLDVANIPYSPDEYVIIVSTLSTLSAFLMLFFFSAVSAALGEFSSISSIVSASVLSVAIAMASFVSVIFLGLMYPSMIASERARNLEKELPFALRQLATQVKAGVSFHKSMSSIVAANYGTLSEEFARVLRDIEQGFSTEQALTRLSKRTKSPGFRKALAQIMRALRAGGNLSDTISAIASDISFELRMKVRDYTERLNFISIVYIMVGVVAPVVVAILSSVVQLPLLGGANMFPFAYIVLIFMAIILVMSLVLFVVKRLDPA